MKRIFSFFLFLLLGVAATQQSATAAFIPDETFEQTRAKAEKGDASAQSNLGFCYSQGQGVAKDDVEAVKWFRKLPNRITPMLNSVWVSATTKAKG